MPASPPARPGYPKPARRPRPPFSLCCTAAGISGHAAATPQVPSRVCGGIPAAARPRPRGHCSLQIGVRVAFSLLHRRDRGHWRLRIEGTCRHRPPPQPWQGRDAGRTPVPKMSLPVSGGPPLLPPPALVPSPLLPPPPRPGQAAGARPAPPRGSVSAPRPCGQPGCQPLSGPGARREVAATWPEPRTVGQRAAAANTPEAPMRIPPAGASGAERS